MTNKISRFAYAPEQVYITHHPHFQGLVDTGEDGRSYLPVVSEILVWLGKQKKVKVLDARTHIKKIHGKAFPETTYVEGDPYSHLNSEGAVRYGQWIVSQLNL